MAGLSTSSSRGDGGSTWCRDSGLRLQKSHTMSGSFRCVWGLRFWEWMKEGNCRQTDGGGGLWRGPGGRRHIWRINERLTHQQGVSDEEDGRVVARQVPVSLVRVELYCKAAWVPHRICRARLPSCPTHTTYQQLNISHTQRKYRPFMMEPNIIFDCMS